MVCPPGSARSSLELCCTVKTASCSDRLRLDAERSQSVEQALAGGRHGGGPGLKERPFLDHGPRLTQPAQVGLPSPARYCIRRRNGRGCSSAVEHDFAKVGVVGSIPIARSNSCALQGVRPLADPQETIHQHCDEGSAPRLDAECVCTGRQPAATASASVQNQRLPLSGSIRICAYQGLHGM